MHYLHVHAIEMRRITSANLMTMIFVIGITILALYMYGLMVRIPRMYILPVSRASPVTNSTLDPVRSQMSGGGNPVSFPIHVPVSTRRGIMSLGGVGRLGNNMFQYAALLGLAMRHNFTPCIHTSYTLTKFFHLTHVSSVKYPNSHVYSEKGAAIYDNNLENLNPNFDWILTGYYQSWKYFRSFENLVRKEFTFKDNILKQVEREFENYHHRIQNRTKIGVHVRRGDMQSKSLQRQGFTVAPSGYFKRAMDYFRNKFKDPIFIVGTDSSLRPVLGSGADIINVNGDTETDMATLSSCDHSIVSTGSYGWWCAWLAGGETVYYQNFPRNGSWLATQYKSEDYYPPSWIPMS